MFRHAWMGVPHPAQWLGGVTTDISRGQRKMATLKKLPHTAPKQKAATRKNQGEKSAVKSTGRGAYRETRPPRLESVGPVGFGLHSPG